MCLAYKHPSYKSHNDPIPWLPSKHLLGSWGWSWLLLEECPTSRMWWWKDHPGAVSHPYTEGL